MSTRSAAFKQGDSKCLSKARYINRAGYSLSSSDDQAFYLKMQKVPLFLRCSLRSLGALLRDCDFQVDPTPIGSLVRDGLGAKGARWFAAVGVMALKSHERWALACHLISEDIEHMGQLAASLGECVDFWPEHWRVAVAAASVASLSSDQRRELVLFLEAHHG